MVMKTGLDLVMLTQNLMLEPLGIHSLKIVLDIERIINNNNERNRMQRHIKELG